MYSLSIKCNYIYNRRNKENIPIIMNEKEQILNLMERIDEISHNKKEQNKTRALNIFSNKEDNVKTFLIITAENPMGNKSDNRTNRRANNSIVDYLNAGNYAWQPVRGKYNNTENSKIIFNISLDEAINIGLQFNQESFIFGEKNDGKTLYHLYVINEDETGYNMVETQDKCEKIIGNNFYTTIDNKNKFNIPFEYFNESCENFNTIINEAKRKSEKYNKEYNRFLNECLKNGKTGRSYYTYRTILYGGLFKK